MSRKSSRVFVIVCVLLILGAMVGSAWYFTRTALDHKDVIGGDSTAVPGFGVTTY